MSQGTDFRKAIAWVVLAVLAVALLAQSRRSELAGLRAREAALARRCDDAYAADMRERVAKAAAGMDPCDGETEAVRLLEKLRRLRQRIVDLEMAGW